MPFDPKTSVREFGVVASEVGMMNLVPRLMREFDRFGGSLRLRVVPLDTRRVSAKLETGEADIALGAFASEPGTTRRQKLYVDRYVCVVRRGHPRLERLSRPEAFWSERHIVVTESSTGHAAHRQVEAALMARLNPERILLRVPSFVACAFVASQTDAVGTMPAKLAESLVEVLPISMFAPPAVLPRIDISQIWHGRVDRDAGHRWLRAKVYELFKA